MKLILRGAIVATRAMLRSNLSPLDVSSCAFRVLPTDLDINLHMNNGRFQQVMDVARIDWLLRTGILQNALANGWRLMLGGVMMRYMRELRPLQPYVVLTRLNGWDKNFFYIEHKFETRCGRLVALGVARATMCTKSGIVSAAAVAADHGQGKSPPLPDYVQAWNAADSLMRKHSRSLTRTPLRYTAAAATSHIGANVSSPGGHQATSPRMQISHETKQDGPAILS